jgi:ribosome-associated protein
VTSEAPRPVDDDAIWARVVCCAHAALDKKGADLAVLDVRGITSIADYFVIVSGRSDTQVRAIAEGIEERCRAAGVRPMAVEGSRNGQWIRLDYGDVVVHVFHDEARRFYDIERLYRDVERLRWAGAHRGTGS